MNSKKICRHFICFFIVVFALTLGNKSVVHAEGFLHTQGKAIVNANGDTILFRGVGLGGWLVPEGYQLHIPGFGSPSSIRQKIVDLIGEEKAAEFYRQYRANYVSAADIDSIASWGFNSIRIPFNYRLLSPEDQPGVYLEEGFGYLDTLLSWCKKNKLYLILDMHCAPGGQNSGNISDSDGIEARLWTEVANQDRTVEIWTKIAERYASEEWIGGYDLLNEPVLPSGYSANKFRAFYMRLAQAIRTVDTNHIIFIEGNWYATDFTSLDPPFDQNMAYSFHKYWSPNGQSSIQSYVNMSSRYKIPLWMGESGENSNSWFFDAVQLFEKNKIGWCWWTHKKVATITSPYSASISSSYQRVLDYWNGTASKPSVDFAYNALLSLAENLKTENCEYRPGVLKALFSPDFGQKAVAVKKLTVPGIIACSDYDIGRETIAYHDVDFQNTKGPGGETWNHGWQYRNDGVDLEKSNDSEGAAYSVGWVESGEWLSYSASVESTANYLISFRVASPNSTGKFQLNLDGETLVPLVEVPNTGGWQSWRTIEVEDVHLPVGPHQLVLKVLQGGFNVNQMKFMATSSTNEGKINRPLPDDFRLVQNYPNPFNGQTFIEYAIPELADVEILIYNSRGQFVKKLVRGQRDKGWYRVTWNPVSEAQMRENLASGIYLYQINAKAQGKKFVSAKRMVLLQ